jgi:hypothetical protein
MSRVVLLAIGPYERVAKEPAADQGNDGEKEETPVPDVC